MLLLMIINGAVAKDTIYNGQSLNTNEYLQNGIYTFIMQGDCNLVLYKNGNIPLWNSQTAGKGNACMATLQNNGNLVILSNTGIVWTSNTYRGPNSYRLVVQGDGNVVIYGAALWATNTAQGRKKLSNSDSLLHWFDMKLLRYKLGSSNLIRDRNVNGVTLGIALLSMLLLMIINGAVAKDTIYNGQSLNTNEYLQNGIYTFIMQGDCNLVLYKNGNIPLWNSQTAGKGNACMATLQNNGNLVILSNTGIVWTSNTNRGPNSYRLVVQGDGNVVIYGAALWATNTVQGRKKLL
ncbi:hypothetical protein Syun_018195 [Stephania yunnanensis]|uniref:Bulb-type lectin domain-containing protein n=1 Tax=Stephania yunnanensis TaxID=152371 RepID=A0AAP0NVK8_9MAGN